MSAFISLSGLSAAQKDLNVTSNNLANAATYGFKESRAEFGDVYSNSIFTQAKTANGQGVQIQQVAQQFHEGTSIYTNNPMDLRVQGGGYFAVSKEQVQAGDYKLTRNGAFHLDKENNIVNANGQYLLGYNVDTDTDQVTSFEPNAINVPDQFGAPKASTKLDLGMNLPADAMAKTTNSPNSFDFNDPNTYNKSTSATVYDSLGQAYKLSTYYVKNPGPLDSPPGPTENSWSVFYTINDGSGQIGLDSAAPYTDEIAGSSTLGVPLAPTTPPTYAVPPTQADIDAVPNYDPTKDPYNVPGMLNAPGDQPGLTVTGEYFNPGNVQYGHSMIFDTSGALQSIGGVGNLSNPPIDPSTISISTVPFGNVAGGAGANMNGGDPTQTLKISFDSPTQYAAPFEVRTFQTDGMTSGYLSKVDIDPKGNILGTYSNGVSKNLGRVALVRVKSEAGLSPAGNTQWDVTQNSGDAMWGEASQGAYGNITSGTLEQSNIDMTQQLVKLITAQRNFQANSRALEVDNSLQQTVLNIR